MKKMAVLVLSGLLALTPAVSDVVKADDMRIENEDLWGNVHLAGALTEESSKYGSDFRYQWYNPDGELFTKGLYFKVINKDTIRFVGSDDSNIDLELKDIKWNGVSFKNLEVGSFKDNNKIEYLSIKGAKKVTFTKECLRGTKKLKTFKLGCDNIVLKEGAFRDCPKLSLVELNGVTSIPKNCFRDCTKLSEIYFGSAKNTKFIKEIGDNAFYGDKNLKSMSIINSKFSTYAKTKSVSTAHKIRLGTKVFDGTTHKMDIKFIDDAGSVAAFQGQKMSDAFSNIGKKNVCLLCISTNSKGVLS